MSTRRLPVRIEALALVALGGFAGANARFAVSAAFPGLRGTLVANVLGSFALGLVLYASQFGAGLSERTRLGVATGFLSSFTTYSTFALQTATAPTWALANVGATYALGFAAVFAGRAVAGRLGGNP